MYPVFFSSRYWLDTGLTPSADLAMTLIDLTDTELQHAAQGARMGAVQADKDAAQQSSPAVRANFQASAERYRELAKKLEQARKAGRR